MEKSEIIKNKVNRDFKGVWISKEIWLDTEMSWMEKLFIAEINSLDNDDGCFASNAYFATFFQLSPGRVSQIIKSLKEKGFISCEYTRNGKEIEKRVLRILNKGIKFSKRGIKYSKEGYLENDKDNNTKNNNTSNNTINMTVFEKWWDTYDKKVGKQKAMKLFSKLPVDLHGEIISHTEKYVKAKPDKKYRKDPERYLKNRAWEDEIVEETTPRDDDRPVILNPDWGKPGA